MIDEALALAGRIAANGPLAVRNTLKMVHEAPDLTEEEAWPRNYELAIEVFASKDSIEGRDRVRGEARAQVDRHLTRRSAR